MENRIDALLAKVTDSSRKYAVEKEAKEKKSGESREKGSYWWDNEVE